MSNHKTESPQWGKRRQNRHCPELRYLKQNRFSSHVETRTDNSGAKGNLGFQTFRGWAQQKCQRNVMAPDLLFRRRDLSIYKSCCKHYFVSFLLTLWAKKYISDEQWLWHKLNVGPHFFYLPVICLSPIYLYHLSICPLLNK